MKKRIFKIILALLALLLLGFGLSRLEIGPFSQKKNGMEARTTQTKESRKSEEQMMEFISVESMNVREQEYGFLELAAECQLPDYSEYFKRYQQEASAGTDAAAFEARLFALAAEAVEREAVDSASYLTREVMVDLSVLDISREKEDWTDKELEKLARQAAFEAELEEFALDIMGEYLTGTVGGEIEDAAWSRENEEEETAEDTLGNGDSQETAILPGGKEAQIS